MNLENQILIAESTFYKSTVIKADDLWLSANKETRMDAFEKAVKKTGMLKSAVSIPLNSFTEIKFNEASETVKFRYINDKKKNKKLSLTFPSKETANNFGTFLGEKLNFQKSIAEENKTKELIWHTLYLLLGIGVTYVFATMDDSSEISSDSGTRRTRGGEVMLRWLHETIGQTGILMIGSAICVYLAYQLYQRYTNPANNIVYSR